MTKATTGYSLAIVLMLCGAARAMTIVSDGQPGAAIVHPAEPTKQELAAARDLQDFIKQISGATLPIQREDQPPAQDRPRHRIMIGKTTFAATHVGKRLTRERLGNEGYVIKTVGDDLVLAGMEVPYRIFRPVRNSGDGTRHAVFDLLERLGCRFFAFHPDGDHVPSSRTIVVEPLDVTAKPDFEFRRLDGSWARHIPRSTYDAWGQWCIKNRLGGAHVPTHHNYSVYSHSPIPRNEKKALFETHPEYFALVEGADGIQRRTLDKQLCLSNPDVLKRTIDAARQYMRQSHDGKFMPGYSLSPNDVNGGWCQCANCKTWDDPDDTVGLAARVLRFNNLVAEALESEFPDRRYPYYAEYGNMPGPPVREDGTVVIKAHPAIIPVYVNIYCLIHDIADPACPPNAEHRRRIDEWRKVAQQLYFYEWYMWNAINPLPVNYVIGARIRYYRDHGATGYIGELMGHSPDNTLSMYIAARMLWDADRDPDQIRNEFFTLYFQESAAAMRDYYHVLNEGVLTSKQHGFRFLALRPNTRMNVSLPLDVSRVAKMKTILGEANRMAKQPIVKRRLLRESKALQLYEYEATIQAMYHENVKDGTPEGIEALRDLFGQYQKQYERVDGIVNYPRKRHVAWRNYVGKLLPETGSDTP